MEGALTPTWGLAEYRGGKRENRLNAHCMLIVGYNDARRSVIVQNSWGADKSMLPRLFFQAFQLLMI